MAIDNIKNAEKNNLNSEIKNRNIIIVQNGIHFHNENQNNNNSNSQKITLLRISSLKAQGQNEHPNLAGQFDRIRNVLNLNINFGKLIKVEFLIFMKLVDDKLEKNTQKMEKGFKRMDEGFKSIDYVFDKIDRRLERLGNMIFF